MDRRAHWEHIYQTKQPHEVSWFQLEAAISLALIQQVAPHKDASILDVGGGASRLVDGLLDRGYSNVAVLDIAAAALEHARGRLVEQASAVDWIEADVLTADLPSALDVWHDRAVFHFLTSEADRIRYVDQLSRAVRPGGHAIIATFADDGPEKCSGLPVARYTAEGLHAQFESHCSMIECTREEHQTPWGASQSFVYCLFQVEM